MRWWGWRRKHFRLKNQKFHTNVWVLVCLLFYIGEMWYFRNTDTSQNFVIFSPVSLEVLQFFRARSTWAEAAAASGPRRIRSRMSMKWTWMKAHSSFERLVLGCIDASDGKNCRIFQQFSWSTRFPDFCTASTSFQLRFKRNILKGRSDVNNVMSQRVLRNNAVISNFAESCCTFSESLYEKMDRFFYRWS